MYASLSRCVGVGVCVCGLDVGVSVHGGGGRCGVGGCGCQRGCIIYLLNDLVLTHTRQLLILPERAPEVVNARLWV